jgi:hypothetical protein
MARPKASGLPQNEGNSVIARLLIAFFTSTTHANLSILDVRPIDPQTNRLLLEALADPQAGLELVRRASVK